MHMHSVARVYAEALLGLARERVGIDAVGAELEELSDVVRRAPDLRAFLESPALEPGEKKRALEAALRDRVDELLVDFVCLLVDKGRVSELAEIGAAYRDLADAASGRSRVRAASAVPLPDDLRGRLEGVLRQKLRRDCVLETEVRPELLGGLVLTIGDKVYDGSVSGRLRRLRETMMRSSGYHED